MHVVLDDVGDGEVREVFAHFVDAEFRADWAEATERLGRDDISVRDLRRTQAQRCADALVAMAHAAAAAPPGAKRAVPTLNVVIDVDTLRAMLEGEPMPITPRRGPSAVRPDRTTARRCAGATTS